MIPAATPANKDPRAGRRSARFAAVQALYQMELTGSDAESVAQEFCEHRFRDGEGCADEALFRRILAGVPHHQVGVDRAIASSLNKDWKLQRIDSILRAILRAAAFELIGREDVPARVVIDEYIEIAGRFFDAEECGFVNAVLDRLAHVYRAAEFDEPPCDDPKGD